MQSICPSPLFRVRLRQPRTQPPLKSNGERPVDLEEPPSDPDTGRTSSAPLVRQWGAHVFGGVMDEYTRQKKWRLANPDKMKAAVKKSRLKRLANMTPEERTEYNRKRKYRTIKPSLPRPNKCEVCFSDGRICLDHDHKTLKFRGWLCEPCNTALGRVRDNPETLRKLAEYLEQRKPS